MLKIIDGSIRWCVELVWGFLTSRDMKALYWYSLTQFIAGGGDILIQQLTEWDPNNMITVGVGLILSRITKKLNQKYGSISKKASD